MSSDDERTTRTRKWTRKTMRRCTLTVEVEYDGRRTDAEALATAMDRLMETALSTPGILSDHGDPEPKVGEFFVLKDEAEDDDGRAGDA